MYHEVDVIVYGTICLDLLWRVDALPPPGGYVEIQEEKKAIGGEAANTAIALSRWGVRTALVGNAIGADADGELLRHLLAQDAPELDLRWVQFGAESQTPYCVCMATPDGRRTMFGHRFADLVCSDLDFDLARSTRFFTMEPNAYESGVKAANVAADAGAFVLPMDYAKDPAVNRLASLVVTSSEHVGRDLGIADLTRFAESVRDEYGPTTIVTVGERGCIAALEEYGDNCQDTIRFPAYVAPRVTDTTGCGDMFRAGLLYGLTTNADLAESIRFGAAAAALNCMEMGGWTGVRSVREIKEYMSTAAIHSL